MADLISEISIKLTSVLKNPLSIQLPDSGFSTKLEQMEVLWWTITFLLMIGGIIGSIVPFLPGPTIVFAGAVLHKLMLPEQSVGWWTIGVIAFLLVASYVIDFISGAAGAKYFGASRWGAIGGILGATVGIFFGLPGIFIGPLVGALLFELLAGKKILPAGKSGFGTLVGTTAGIILKVVISIVMVLAFIIGLFF